MKKRLFAILLVAVLALTVFTTGCQKPAAPAEKPAEPTAPTGAPIKIGVIGPLSGEYSQYGLAVENGAKLAAEEINAAGGVNGSTVEIVAYDSKGDKTEAVNAYNRLRDQDKIIGLVGGTFSGTTLAIKELTIADNMPVLTPTATNLEVTLNAPNVFRACYTDPYQGGAAAVFATQNLNAKKAAVLFNIEDPYSEGLAEAFKTKFSEAGEITNYEGYTKNDADFKTILTKIEANKPDVLFLPDYIAKVGVILNQVKELGIDVVCIGGDGWDGIEEDYMAVAEGHYFANHYAKSDEAPVVQTFIKAYTDKHQKTPNALAALAYDAVKIMAEAVKTANTTESKALIEALAKTNFTGVTGNVTFDANGDPQKSISIIQIKDGDLTLVTKVENK